MKDLPFTFRALHESYKDGVSPAEIIREVFRRIEAVGDPGIFIHLCNVEDVIAEAEALGAFSADKPLWGIPFVIKDNIDAAGLPTTAACPAYRYVASEDAFVVAQLRAAGALMIGKTNLDQFATGLVGVRSPYPPPKNAIDPTIVPGGSSSGSAVAVAHGLVSFSLGTDTAGSGRVPAAFNNLVGLKPTLGTISASGVVPACRTLDTISIFALTVEDAYSAFTVAARYDSEDAYARELQITPPSAPPPHFKIGIPSTATIEFFGDEAQEASFSASLELLREAGGEIVELDFSAFFDVARMLYEGAWVAERYTVIEELLRDNPGALHPVTKQIISAAEKLSAADAFRGLYRLQELKRIAEQLLNAVDLFCVPTIPTFYSLAELEADPVTANSRLGTYTNFVNLLDMCGLAVPVPARNDGRPGSVTLLAKAGLDGLLASIAMPLERAGGRQLGATKWSIPTSTTPPQRAIAGEFEIAVCGAHMSGLPLNKELTKLGGRFLRGSRTDAGYRFFALAGGPPYRPGLIRDTDGGEIELEIWALPQAAVGAFMNGIPAPLGIGTIGLADGSSVKGFLCEPTGTLEAQDITALASWRKFISQKV